MRRAASLGLIVAGLAAGLLLLAVTELPWRGLLPALVTVVALGPVEVLLVRRYLRSDAAIWQLDDVIFPFVSLGMAVACLMAR